MEKIIIDAVERYIRLDNYFEKLRIRGTDVTLRKQFGIPDEGFKRVADLSTWKIPFDKERTEEWNKALYNTLAEIGLCKPEQIIYFKNLEQFLLLNSNGGYMVEQEHLSRERQEDNYLRNKRLFSIYQKNLQLPKEKRKLASKLSEELSPNLTTVTTIDYDNWLDKYAVTSGAAFRKIISKHKKRYS